MTTRARKGRILVYSNSIGGKPIDPSNIQNGAVIVYDEEHGIYKYINLSEIFALIDHDHQGTYLEEITKELVEAVLTGTITSHDHAGVYSLNSHNHDGTYLTAITKAMVEAVLTGNITSHTHSAYALATHNHDGTYLTAITKAMVEAVLTGAITTHTHAYIATSHTVNAIINGTGFLKNNGTGTWSWDNSTYLTAITKAMVEAVLTGDITSHSHSIYSLAAHNHDGTYLTAITKAMVEAVLTGNITTHTHSLYPLRGQLSNSDGTNSIIALDTRNANPIPSADLKFGVWFDFKGTSAIGLTGLGQGIWAGVMTLVPYGDDSGNNSAAFRFAHSNQNLFFQGYTGASWLSWRRVLDTSNFIPGTHYQIPITKEIVEGVLTGAITSHTHLYAGSSSAGGAATTALACTGNSASATILVTARTLTIGNTGKTFNGSANVAWTLAEIGAAPTTHNHTKAQITDFPTSMPASDVYAWAKAASKPTYTAGEVGAEPSFTKNNAFNKNFGTAAGTVCQGNDSRLSDARTPTDNSVTYAKLNSTLTSRQALVSGALDWSLGGVYTRSLTANTTFTFSNLQLNKTITLVLSGNYTITLPTYCKRISGSYDGSTANYIQLHCTNATGGSEEVWFTISKQAT